MYQQVWSGRIVGSRQLLRCPSFAYAIGDWECCSISSLRAEIIVFLLLSSLRTSFSQNSFMFSSNKSRGDLVSFELLHVHRHLFEEIPHRLKTDAWAAPYSTSAGKQTWIQFFFVLTSIWPGVELKPARWGKPRLDFATVWPKLQLEYSIGQPIAGSPYTSVEYN